MLISFWIAWSEFQKMKVWKVHEVTYDIYFYHEKDMTIWPWVSTESLTFQYDKCCHIIKKKIGIDVIQKMSNIYLNMVICFMKLCK